MNIRKWGEIILIISIWSNACLRIKKDPNNFPDMSAVPILHIALACWKFNEIP